MQKLTQKDAIYIVQESWKEVVKCNLGTYRFGEALVFSFTKYIGMDNTLDYGLDDLVCDDLHYEANSDRALAKFYQHFVEDSNN